MRLLHASDFHLDSPFSNLPLERAMQRRRELRALPQRLAQLALACQADLLLLPGDLFDGARVYPETIQALTTALAALPIPVVIAPGNHDYYHSFSPYATVSWPDNVHIFTRPVLESFALPRLNCVIHGCAFTTPHREDEPLSGFHAPEDGRLHLLCVHGEIGLGGRYAPIPPPALAQSGVVYAALGHIHTRSHGIEGSTFWAYPGCPEGRGFDELGSKGVLLVSPDGQALPPIDAHGLGASLPVCSPSPACPVSAVYLPLCQRQYRVERVALSAFETALSPSPSPDLVRLILTGEAEIPPDLNALTALATPSFFHVELRDETTLPQVLWARSGEDSLTGLYLREMRRQLNESTAENRATILLAARLGLAALEGREDPCP